MVTFYLHRPCFLPAHVAPCQSARDPNHAEGLPASQFDIKSPNILLTGAEDSVGTAKVADVGLARFLQKDAFSKVSGVGTLQWTAPEILG